MSSYKKGREVSYDVIVVGGGPAGMMAAGTAVRRGLRVLLLEKNRELGKKLSITGGGRCNITNAEPDIHAFLAHYGDAAKYLYSAFAQFGVNETFQFFESHGLPLVVEARKRVFPKSQQATDVTRTMKRFASQSGVTIKNGVTVKELRAEDGRITGVVTNDGTFGAHSVVLSSGGASRPETGSSGDGFRWLRELGHTVSDPNPDIVPLTADEDWVKDLSGTTLSFMKITFGEGKRAFSRTGKILFTHFGISGPLVLNSAREVKKLLARGPVTATIDLYPDTDTGALRKRVLAVFDAHKNKALKNVLAEIAPRGMAEAVAAGLDEELRETRVHSVSKEARYALVDRLKAMPLTITGTLGYDKAVVSDGGVDLREIDTRTMASKMYPNLFFTGDVLHITRPSGGFSLQLCWTTGYVAGMHA